MAFDADELLRSAETPGWTREGVRVDPRFGASGLLRDEIAAGAEAGVFASANMEHPRSPADARRTGPVVLFARNRLCALIYLPDLLHQRRYPETCPSAGQDSTMSDRTASQGTVSNVE